MIQDIAPHHFNNQYENREICDRDSVIVLKDSQLLFTDQNGIRRFPLYCETEQGSRKERPVFLFKVDDHAYYSMEKVSFTVNTVTEDISRIRQFTDPVLAMASITAVQLIRWRRSRKYCSVCAAPMIDSPTERARICPHCHHTEYPVISPCIIVAVIDRQKGKLLIVRSHTNTVRYALVAGYVEIGETLEEAVRREVKEETGLDICNIRYYGSQPWAFSSTQMMAYTADLDGDPALHIQQSEIREAYWVLPEELDPLDRTVSIGHTLIEQFRRKELR